MITTPPGYPLFGETSVTLGVLVGWYVNLSAALVAEVPFVPVTVTSTAPVPVEAGETAVIEVAEFTVTLVAAVDPNLTVSPEANPVPVIVTDVPPGVMPLVGLIAVTVGGEMYVNWSAELVAELPPELATVTSTVPVPAGETAVIDVAELTVTLVAAVAPNLTVLPEANPVPVIVTDVPPAVLPAVGLIAVTVGAT